MGNPHRRDGVLVRVLRALMKVSAKKAEKCGGLGLGVRSCTASMKAPPKRKGNARCSGLLVELPCDASMKALPKWKGNFRPGGRSDFQSPHASMKALPKRKGNAVPALQFLKSETASMKSLRTGREIRTHTPSLAHSLPSLNESPSEKEGKLIS